MRRRKPVNRGLGLCVRNGCNSMAEIVHNQKVRIDGSIQRSGYCRRCQRIRQRVYSERRTGVPVEPIIKDDPVRPYAERRNNNNRILSRPFYST